MTNQPRILCLLNLLAKYTDEDHQLGTNDLINLLLSEYGISEHRVTIKTNIKKLQDAGYDIIETRANQNLYFLGDRKFEIPEIKLLIDAIESSKFITRNKSDQLIEKLNGLVSVYQTDLLQQQNYVLDKIKTDNEQVYYIVNVINNAIHKNKQITFQYFDYDREKRKILKNDGEKYIFSPYHLIIYGDYYYVLGYSDKHNKVISFRVDRIAGTPEMLDEECVKKPDDFDLNKYTKATFSMFGGKTYEVSLKVHNKLLKAIIDRFGENVKTEIYDDDFIKVTTLIDVSDTFYGWIFGFKGKIEILEPSIIKEEYKQMIKDAYKNIK